MSRNPAKRKHCICGHSWYFSKMDYIKMILFGGITVNCPQCQRKHRFKLIYYATEQFNETRITNKQVSDAEEKLWRRS